MGMPFVRLSVRQSVILSVCLKQMCVRSISPIFVTFILQNFDQIMDY